MTVFSDWDSKKNPTIEVLTLFIKYEGIIYLTYKERARKKKKKKGFQLKKKKKKKKQKRTQKIYACHQCSPQENGCQSSKGSISQ